MTMGICGSPPVIAPPAASQEHLQRKPRAYTPSIWRDFFLNHQQFTPLQLDSMKERAERKQEEVRQIILHAGASSDLGFKLELIDTLQRIGVDYRFGKEIDQLLRAVHDDAQHESSCCGDLYVASLRFYLLRKHGYSVCSADVFVKFRDDQGNFASNDIKCLLALYDAANLRTRGEEILDSAIVFTKRRLQSLMKTLEPEMAAEVQHTLETPSYRRVHRVEARRYISVYEKLATRDDTVLEFAKLDYNILQTLYCEELKALTLWWKGLRSQAYARFARDRVVEMHFWMHGVLYEPHHSYSRIVLTKWLKLLSLVDDFCDNYSTTEEYEIFIASMERWDKQAAEKLPACLKEILTFILDTINDIVEELKLQKNKHAEMVRELFIDIAKGYGAEDKWRDEEYVPSKDAIEWAFSYPEMIRAVCIVGRISNDIMSHEREQASKHVASTVQACMKENGIMRVDQANEKLRALIDEAWMDIIQGYLQRAHPTELLEKAVNVARIMDNIYKRDDAYTNPHSLKDTVTSIYVNPV
ncbi:hypothetical protein BS78_02G104000 [Paspalum vaginatum]|nr:hypothetical protein BS78_02G104000 [Paspalum vaginatum]